MDLPSLLQGIQSPDDNTRNHAEAQLQAAVESNYEGAVIALCGALATEGLDVGNRMQAALYLKNLFTAQDENIKRAKLSKWNDVTPQTAEQFRLGLLQALQSPDANVSKSAAQAVAALAAYDVPRGVWPNLLPTLLNNVNAATMSLPTKIASLNALGYMCETVNDIDTYEKSVVDQILHTVVSGMEASKPNEIKLAAIKALIDALEFTEQHFNVDQERNAIMSSVCSLASCELGEVREKVYECLALIAEQYYKFMMPYMEVLFPLTADAIASDVPQVGKMALEFWTSMFDAESNVIDDGETSLDIGKRVLTPLIPIIWDTLLKQSEEEDDDELTIADSGGLCLSALVGCVRDDVITVVMPIVTQNINVPQWRQKDAALFAYGTLMAACQSETLHASVPESIPTMVQGMQDPHWRVRDTSAWAIGQVLREHFDLVQKKQIDTLIAGLLHLIDDQSVPVSRKAVNSILQFAEAFEDERDTPTNGISKYAQSLVTKLLTTASKADCEITMEAYEAASMVIDMCATDQLSLVVEVLKEAIIRLQNTFQETLEVEERAVKQSLICGLVNTCTRKLPGEMLVLSADALMNCVLEVLRMSNAGAQEECFQTIGNVADKIGDTFERYIEYTAPMILKGVQQINERTVCTHAISSLKCIFASLKKKILIYSDPFVAELLNVLRSDTADRSLKPIAISALGELAEAIDGDFERYHTVVLDILQMAQSQNAGPEDDQELKDYIEVLRESILDAYTGITEGLKNGGKLQIMNPYVNSIFTFIAVLLQMPDCPPYLLNKAIGFIGDMGSAFGKPLEPLLINPIIIQGIQHGEQRARGMNQEDEGLGDSLLDTCHFSMKVIERVRTLPK